MGRIVYVPDKRENLVQEALSDLYLLRQAVDYQSGTTDSRLSMIDKIRNKLQRVAKGFDESRKEN
jgi:hypothetical protein